MRRLTLLLLASACSPAPAEPHPALLEAVDWYTGVAGTVDDARARELLELAVAREGPLALMWLAHVHSTGRMGFASDEERAGAIAAQVIDEVERAAEAGVLEAVFLMGTAYDEGLGKPVDPVQAAAWHRRAGGRGHVLGAHNLGNAYEAGRGVTRDLERAREWYGRAAAAGNRQAQEALERLEG